MKISVTPTKTAHAHNLERQGSQAAQASPPIAAADESQDRISLQNSSKSKRKLGFGLSLILFGGIVGGAVSGGLHKYYSEKEAGLNCYPKPPPVPPPMPTPTNYTTSDFGIYNAAPEILESTNAAELYLNESKNARSLFDRLKNSGSPVPVNYFSGNNSDEKSGSIDWNDKHLSQSLTDFFNATSVSCGTNSPALFLAHESNHADWQRTNPLGQEILVALNGYPFYDNLEEARVVLATNHIAADLGESQRSTHHGTYSYPVNSVSETLGGICPDGNLPPEYPAINAAFGHGRSSEYQQLSDGATSRLYIWSQLQPYAASIPDDLTKELNDLLEERDRVFTHLNAAISSKNINEIDLRSILEPHIHNAINITSKFEGIKNTTLPGAR